MASVRIGLDLRKMQDAKRRALPLRRRVGRRILRSDPPSATGAPAVAQPAVRPHDPPLSLSAPRSRRPGVYALLVWLVVVAGLASRAVPQALPASLGKYPGDALWALMVFLLVGLARPRWSTGAVAATALAVSWGVEFGQLYQPPWLTAVRATTLGHLVLGSHFHAPDLLAYAVGIAAGAAAELAAVHRRRSSP